MDARGERRDSAASDQAGSRDVLSGDQRPSSSTGLPAEENADDEEYPALVRACVDELMDLLIEISEQWREVVQLRESTREILKRLRTA